MCAGVGCVVCGVREVEGEGRRVCACRGVCGVWWQVCVAKGRRGVSVVVAMAGMWAKRAGGRRVRQEVSTGRWRKENYPPKEGL